MMMNWKFSSIQYIRYLLAYTHWNKETQPLKFLLRFSFSESCLLLIMIMFCKSYFKPLKLILFILECNIVSIFCYLDHVMLRSALDHGSRKKMETPNFDFPISRFQGGFPKSTLYENFAAAVFLALYSQWKVKSEKDIIVLYI